MPKQDSLADMPTSLGGQMKLHLAAYVFGAVMLATFQFSMNRIDWLSKSAIDLVFGQNPVDSWRPAAMMLGLAVVAFATRVSSRWFIFNAGRDVEYDLRALLLRRLHGLGAAFYRKMSAGEIMSRSTNDLTQVRLLTGFGILNIINVVFGLGSALQVMLGISPKLTVATMVTLPFLVLLTRSFSRNLFLRTRQNQETLGKLSESLQTNLAGVRVVRSFALENRELQRFRVANGAYLDASLGLARLRGSMQPIMGATGAVGILIFFWYGGSLLLRGPADHGLSPGDFFAFSLALTRMMWPMVALGFALSIVQRGRAGHARLREVFEAIPEVSDGPNAPPEIVKGALRVEHLGFAYGDRVVLDDVSFTVPAGKSLAIVGRTGSGKSTAAMLLARLLPTPKHSVFIDDIDICTVPLSFVRRALGYAQQDAFLFSTTVSRNIGYALADAESEVGANIIRDAAREAQVLEEALGLPEQFDTVVGERGVQLSGGQKQRIALARALAWEPKILILDDPLSAVDAKTEAAILKSIERQAEKRTVVLITHRVAAAARCDQVIVLDQGRVIERGTHDELVANHGLYAAFAEEQRMARELAEMEAEPVPSEPPQAEKAGAA
jgi:ATP-binding cassette subfamily B protein